MYNPHPPLSAILAACLAFLLVAASRIQAAPKEEDRIHPGFDLTVIRPKGFEPRVTGLEFLPGGRMAVSTLRPNNCSSSPDMMAPSRE